MIILPRIISLHFFEKNFLFIKESISSPRGEFFQSPKENILSSLVLVCMWYVPCTIAPHGNLWHPICIDIIKKWLRWWIHFLEVRKLNQLATSCELHLVMMDVVKTLEGTWCLPLLWKHGSKPGSSKFSLKNVWSVFGKCAKNRGTRRTWESKPWIWEQKEKSTYEHCNVPKTSKNYSSDPFMCFSRKSFPRVVGICFPRKWSLEKWGNIFSKCEEMSSWGTLPIIEYFSWRNVISGNYLHEEPFPQYVSLGIPPPIFSRQDLALCSTRGSCFRIWRIHYFPWEGNQPLLSPRKPFSWKLSY